MVRWIAFDENTAASIAEKTGDQAGIVKSDVDALGLALRSSQASVVVVPARTPPTETEQVLMLKMERKSRPEKPAPPAAKQAARESVSEPVGYVATGFLGLNDEPVFEEDDPPRPKKWWQKILG